MFANILPFIIRIQGPSGLKQQALQAAYVQGLTTGALGAAVILIIVYLLWRH